MNQNLPEEQRTKTNPLLCLLVGLVGFLTMLGTTTNAANPSSDKGDAVVTGGDLVFMNTAAPGGMAEVELGRLALKQAAGSEVKEFAQKMITDHSKAGRKLEALATKKNVTLPSTLTPQQKQTMEKLTKLSGPDFNRAYVSAMVMAHEKDVAAFQNVAKNGTDADVKAFAAGTLPTLEKHLQMIKALANKMGLKPQE